MSVRPVLLGLYEKYFLPLQKLLLPSLQAFLVGLLPGLEEGSEIYDRLVGLVPRVRLYLSGFGVFHFHCRSTDTHMMGLGGTEKAGLIHISLFTT